MPTPFTITTGSNTVVLNAERKGESAFTVTNISGRPLRGRGVLKPLRQTATDWLSVAGEAERDFGIGATQQYVVQVAVSPEAAVGDYTFRLDAVDVDNPDENFTQGPRVTFQVAPQPVPPPAPKPFPWWLVAVAAGVLVLVVLAAVILPPLITPHPKVTIRVTGVDDELEVMVNGTSAFIAGFGQDGREVDVTSLIQRGRNTFMTVVRNNGGPCGGGIAILVDGTQRKSWSAGRSGDQPPGVCVMAVIDLDL